MCFVNFVNKIYFNGMARRGAVEVFAEILGVTIVACKLYSSRHDEEGTRGESGERKIKVSGRDC